MLERSGAPQHPRPGPSAPAEHNGLTFQWEPLKDLLSELAPLVRRHYEEVGVGDDLDPDFLNLLFFAATGRYHMATARTEGGALVGYCAGWVVGTLIDRKAKVLCLNAIYLDPLYRTGLEPANAFMRMMEDLGKREGCQRMEMSPQGRNRFRMGTWLKRFWGFKDSPEPCYWREF